jgi:hypothetical protein
MREATATVINLPVIDRDRRASSPECHDTAPDWQAIVRLLPRPAPVGRPRSDDDYVLIAALFCEAARPLEISLSNLCGRSRGNAFARKLKVLETCGAWPLIVEAARAQGILKAFRERRFDAVNRLSEIEQGALLARLAELAGFDGASR